MKPYRLTPAAQRDLSQIWDYSEVHWDAVQAERYLRQIQAAIERVAADPACGRACDEIRVGYRRYATGSHVVFYVDAPGSVDVMRVLHQRMDPDRHL